MRKLTANEMGRLTPEQFREATKVPLVAVLDNVRSLHNVGAVFRTADAFALAEVVLCGIACHPEAGQAWPSDVHKTALGAEETVSYRYFRETSEAVRTLQCEGYTVLTIEQAEGSVMLSDLQVDRNKKYAVVFGHEVFGVQQEVVDMADGCIEIPQFGTKHSLNVSVTAGIVLYELSSQLR